MSEVLRRWLETFERLQHCELKRHERWRDGRATIPSETNPGSISVDEEAQATSDEESRVVMGKEPFLGVDVLFMLPLFPLKKRVVHYDLSKYEF